MVVDIAISMALQYACLKAVGGRLINYSLHILIHMGIETKYGARATYEDGTIETWTSSEGVNISGEALATFAKLCIIPYPVSVEIVELTPEPNCQ